MVMYTLKRGEDGKLHGPLNKKLYATFAGRKAAAPWARREATKRGFGPETTKLLLDGALLASQSVTNASGQGFVVSHRSVSSSVINAPAL